MKYIKLFENFKEQDIHEICKEYSIENYTINDDGSIDVNGDVSLYNRYLTKIPLRFRNVTGYFDCSYNNLTSLEGSPVSVGGDFKCSYNQLTSLEFMSKIGSYFNCDYNNIIDFIGFIEPVGNFYCVSNPICYIWSLFGNKEHVELLNDYDCIRGENIIIDRLNMFLEEIDKPIVKSVGGYNNI